VLLNATELEAIPNDTFLYYARNPCCRVACLQPVPCRVTSNITEMGAYGHLEVLKNKATLSQIREVIREIASNPDGEMPVSSDPPRLPQWPASDDQLGEDAHNPEDTFT
jgi:hypothetical protein